MWRHGLQGDRTTIVPHLLRHAQGKRAQVLLPALTVLLSVLHLPIDCANLSQAGYRCRSGARSSCEKWYGLLYFYLVLCLFLHFILNVVEFFFVDLVFVLRVDFLAGEVDFWAKDGICHF